MIQNGITNFVSLLDNIMVGRLGTEVMSGVSIVNQLLFVLQLLLFGAVSCGGNIHRAVSRHGKHGRRSLYLSLQDNSQSPDGSGRHRNIFMLRRRADIAFSARRRLGRRHGADACGGQKYLLAALFGLIPYALSQAYSSTLRETGSAMIPMVASIAAVVTNFCLNLILIFGLLGAPKLGAVGAAIATVTSRFVELAVLAVWTHKNKLRCPFAVGAFRSLYIPGHLVREITVKGMPLMLNEGLWVFGMTFRNQIYSGAGAYRRCGAEHLSHGR